ncbi:MAG: ricin-type beta-trefoil lectin domain protein [Pseudomonadota bacterium]
MKKALYCVATAIAACAGVAQAEAPHIKTAAPVIHLADNLDEKDNLWWCIDTLGRGFGERLQAHSCKPNGGDVQFELDAGMIRSVAFPEYCMALAPNDDTTFALVSCDAMQSSQQFSYEPQTGNITLAADDAQCVAVGGESRSAGPYMSRVLTLADCAEAQVELVQWVVVP